MAREKHYYLIVQWQPHRNTTEEKPSCIFGTQNYFVTFPLQSIDPKRCYTNLKRAENYAIKNTTLYTKCKVIEVPESALRKDGNKNG